MLSDGFIARQTTPEKLMNSSRIYPLMVKLQILSQHSVFRMNTSPICQSKNKAEHIADSRKSTEQRSTYTCGMIAVIGKSTAVQSARKVKPALLWKRISG